MKPDRILVFILALINFSCGNAEHFARQGVSGNPLRAKARKPNPAKSAPGLNGVLQSFSSYDQSDPALADGFPFMASATSDPEASIKITEGKGALGYIKNANLVVRALKQIPPRDSIQALKSFRLRLKGTRLYSASNAVPAVQNLVLCLLDGKACIGSKPESGQASTVQQSVQQSVQSSVQPNTVFWENAKIESASLFRAEEFKVVGAVESGGVLGASISDEVVIDLMALYHLSSTGAVDFIFEHSVEFTTSKAGYRKFRLALGNRIYFDSGLLEIEFDVNSKLLPKNFTSLPAEPLNGPQDQSSVKTSAAPEKDSLESV